MKYVGGWSFTEAYNLPVGLRIWFVTRLSKQLEAEADQAEKASKGKGSSKSTQLTSNNAPSPPPQLGNFRKS